MYTLINLFNKNVCVFKKNKKKYIYIYNKNYFILFLISCETNIFFKTKKSFFLKSNIPVNVVGHHQVGWFNLKKQTEMFLKQFCTYEYSKIKFSGKGYKIKKHNKNSIALIFNRAHMTRFFFQHIFLKKLKKYKIYMRYTQRCLKSVDELVNTRKVNIFTKKGLRVTRQLLKKKKGKNK